MIYYEHVGDMPEMDMITCNLNYVKVNIRWKENVADHGRIHYIFGLLFTHLEATLEGITGDISRCRIRTRISNI